MIYIKYIYISYNNFKIEPIYVVVTLINPMKIPLELNNIILDCELTPSNDESTQPINSSYENDSNYLHYQYYSLQQIGYVKLAPNSKEKVIINK